MPIKDPVKRKAYHKEYVKKHYQANKEYYRKRNGDATKVVVEHIRAAKEKPCMDCGNSYPYYVMDFDHRYGKKFTIARMRKRGINQVKAEIAKCDVVCANCHRKRTHAPVAQQTERCVSTACVEGAIPSRGTNLGDTWK